MASLGLKLVRRILPRHLSPALATTSVPLWSVQSTAVMVKTKMYNAVPMRALSTGADWKAKDFEQMLTKNGRDETAVKRCYLKLAREYHPDANPEDPDAAAKFVHLGKTYEKLQKAIGSDMDEQDLDYDDEDEDSYGEEEARVTYSGAGGPVLTREMKRELRKIRDEMASGGARDGGWFALAAQYGDDDGVQDLPGGPNFSGPQLQLDDGKKKRRRRKR